MMMGFASGIAAVLLANAVGSVQGCSNFVLAENYGSPYPTETLSIRSLDFHTIKNLKFFVSATPGNANITLLSLPNGKHMTTDYGFVCTTVATELIVKAKGIEKTAYPGPCVDGMNTAGLSGGLLEDTEAGYRKETMSAYPMATNSTGEILYLELITYMLATCDTVACVNSTMANISVVNSPELKTVVKKVLEIASSYPSHFVFTDATGASIAIEWPAVNTTDGVSAPVITNLVHGVLTNDPSLDVQEAMFEEYINGVADKLNTTVVYATTDNNNNNVPNNRRRSSSSRRTTSTTTVNVWGNWPGGALFDNTAANNEGNVRYTRLRMLRENVGKSAYTTVDTLSPGHYGTFTAAARLIDSVFQYVMVPGGKENYLTMWSVMRDHVRGNFYVRTAYNLNWHRIDVSKATKSGEQVSHVALEKVVAPVWWSDVTSML